MDASTLRQLAAMGFLEGISPSPANASEHARKPVNPYAGLVDSVDRGAEWLADMFPRISRPLSLTEEGWTGGTSPEQQIGGVVQTIGPMGFLDGNISPGTVRALHAAAAKDAAIKARSSGKITGALKGDALPAPDLGGYSIFDYSKMDRPPTIEQTPLPRKQGVGGKPTARMKDLQEDPYVRKGVESAVKRGVEFRNWYNITPFEEAWLNERPDPESLKRFLTYQTIASQRNPVPNQLKTGSYLWHLAESGLLDDGVDVVLPKGYGGLAQKQIIADSKMFASGIPLDPLKSPKRASYIENWYGNQLPVTADTHAVRLPAMLSHDPRWLAESIGETGARRSPRKEWESGDLALSDALKQPGLWEAAPNGSEYGSMEKLWQDVAQKVGIRPAQAQASGWVGGGNVTGLKSRPQLFLQAVEDRIAKTAAERNMTPGQVIRELAWGRMPLLSAGGLGAGLLSAEDQYQ